jgi:predicted transcriptional regulator
MSEHTAVSAKVPKDLSRRLDLLARATKRSKSELVTQAIEDYVALQEWQVQAIEEGIADADAVNFVSHEEVCEKLARWGKK